MWKVHFLSQEWKKSISARLARTGMMRTSPDGASVFRIVGSVMTITSIIAIYIRDQWPTNSLENSSKDAED